MFEDQTVILPIEADLRGIEPGEYFLGIRRSEFRWAFTEFTQGESGSVLTESAIFLLSFYTSRDSLI